MAKKEIISIFWYFEEALTAPTISETENSLSINIVQTFVKNLLQKSQ